MAIHYTCTHVHTTLCTYVPVSQKVGVVCEELCGVLSAAPRLQAGLIDQLPVLLPVRTDREDLRRWLLGRPTRTTEQLLRAFHLGE